MKIVLYEFTLRSNLDLNPLQLYSKYLINKLRHRCWFSA